MQKRIRRVFTSMREHTCVSYAKIATMGGFCDVDFIIVKATSHDDIPLPNKYVDELLKIFSISPSSYRAFALSFTCRFRKTHSWRVALKCLLLLHRLLRSLPNHTPFRAELLWCRTNGKLSLYPCNFRDCSSSASEDYTSFIRSYARLLDEALDCISMDTTQEEEADDEPHRMKELGRMIEMLPQLQNQIDRVIDCRPSGAASRSFLVESAMKYVIRHSFSCYTTLRRDIEMVLENLIELPYRSSAAAFAIYKKAAFQADELSEFHECCKSMGYCGSYEYPFIARIPEIQIRALENFLNGMWQLTDQSSSSNISTQTTSNVESPISLPCKDGDKLARGGAELDDQLMKKDMEMEPLLIQWEVDNSVNSFGWEDLLDASICGNSSTNGWQMQVYNPHVEQQTHRTNFYYGSSCPNTAMLTWWEL